MHVDQKAETEGIGKQVSAGVISLLLGLAGGYLYLLSLDLMILALSVLVFALVVGGARPRQPWLAAILLSLGAPVPAVAVRLHGPTADTSPMASVVVAGVASSFLGTYAGYAARRMIANVLGRN